MNYTVAKALPVPLTLNGTQYLLPRFLSDQFDAWVALRQNAKMEEALAELGPDPDKRAQYKTYFHVPAMDVAALMDEVRSPAGYRYVNEVCMKAAGVPDDVRQTFHANADPMFARNLGVELASNRQAANTLNSESGDPGEGGNPPTGQPLTSGGSPVTTATTQPTLPVTTPAETQAA